MTRSGKHFLAGVSFSVLAAVSIFSRERSRFYPPTIVKQDSIEKGRFFPGTEFERRIDTVYALSSQLMGKTMTVDQAAQANNQLFSIIVRMYSVSRIDSIKVKK